LKTDGDYEGALSEIPATELIKLLDGWCPHAKVIRAHVDSVFK
jgi:hypothetical protein